MPIPKSIGRSIGKRRKQVGALGEALVLKHLKNKGFKHLHSNYLKRQGELDLVVEFEGKIHFIEVKTVSRENFVPKTQVSANIHDKTNVIRETLEHLPEENVSAWKIRKLGRVVQIYIEENHLYEKEWQFDIAVVYLDRGNRRAYIKFIKDIPLVG